MHRRVGREGHHAVLHFIADLAELAFLPIVGELAPFGNVQRTPAIANVVREPPGEGRDVRVPGPDGFVGMTVAAGTIEDRRDLRSHLRLRINCLRFINRWVGSSWSYRLNADDEYEQQNRHHFQNSAHPWSLF